MDHVTFTIVTFYQKKMFSMPIVGLSFPGGSYYRRAARCAVRQAVLGGQGRDGQAGDAQGGPPLVPDNMPQRDNVISIQYQSPEPHTHKRPGKMIIAGLESFSGELHQIMQEPLRRQTTPGNVQTALPCPITATILMVAMNGHCVLLTNIPCVLNSQIDN